MWIKNKKTEVIWEIVDKAQITKLLNSGDYVESRKVVAEKKTKSKED